MVADGPLSSSRFAALDEYCRNDLSYSLSKRLLSSETIVQLVVSLLGVHWHVRTNLSVITGGSSAQLRQQSEQAALKTVLLLFAIIFEIAAETLQATGPVRSHHHESAIVDDDLQLAQWISNVLRRLLPSLRIASKWIKLNFDYISRLAEHHPASNETLRELWRQYAKFASELKRVFPINQLPSLTGPLEEDIDLRGFGPLSRGLTTHGGRPLGESTGTEVEDNAPRDGEEEQLMRISDLLVDMTLIVNSAVSTIPQFSRRDVQS